MTINKDTLFDVAASLQEKGESLNRAKVKQEVIRELMVFIILFCAFSKLLVYICF